VFAERAIIGLKGGVPAEIVLKNATIYLDASAKPVPYVLTDAGRRIGSVRRPFEMACRQAGIADLVFYDRRHTVVRNMRRAGVGYFRIMAITGHKTMSAFRRYHTLDHRDLRQAIGHLDT
jgi:integrase